MGHIFWKMSETGIRRKEGEGGVLLDQLEDLQAGHDTGHPAPAPGYQMDDWQTGHPVHDTSWQPGPFPQGKKECCAECDSSCFLPVLVALVAAVGALLLRHTWQTRRRRKSAGFQILEEEEEEIEVWRKPQRCHQPHQPQDHLQNCPPAGKEHRRSVFSQTSFAEAGISRISNTSMLSSIDLDQSPVRIATPTSAPTVQPLTRIPNAHQPVRMSRHRRTSSDNIKLNRALTYPLPPSPDLPYQDGESPSLHRNNSAALQKRFQFRNKRYQTVAHQPSLVQSRRISMRPDASCLTCELISMGSSAPYLGSTCPECGADHRAMWS